MLTVLTNNVHFGARVWVGQIIIQTKKEWETHVPIRVSRFTLGIQLINGVVARPNIIMGERLSQQPATQQPATPSLFSPAEDEKLKAAVEAHTLEDGVDWTSIARHMGEDQFSRKRCRDRFNTYLSPAIKRRPISEDEKMYILLELYTYPQHGKRRTQADIARELKHSPNDVKHLVESMLPLLRGDRFTMAPLCSLAPALAGQGAAADAGDAEQHAAAYAREEQRLLAMEINDLRKLAKGYGKPYDATKKKVELVRSLLGREETETNEG